MRIAPEWREQSARYMGPGRSILRTKVGEESLSVVNLLKRREINLNHGGESWAVDYVEAMLDWGYNKDVVVAVGEEIATKMNGRGDDFLEKLYVEVDRVFE